jgi:hypothetical protein
MATFSDSFTRANTGVNGGLGSDWTSMHNYLEILSNKVTTSTTGTNCAYYVATATANFTDDQEAQIVVSGLSSSDRVSPMVRMDSGTGYSLFCDGQAGSNRRLTKITGSTSFTTIGTVDIVPVNGDTVKIKAVGTTISAYINGVLIDSVTDSSYTTGQPGIMYRRSGTGGSQIDDFNAADVATGLTITSVNTTNTVFSAQTNSAVVGTGLSASVVCTYAGIACTNESASSSTSLKITFPNFFTNNIKLGRNYEFKVVG